MPLSRQASRRLGLSAVVCATALVAACDTTVSFSPNELLWGFVTIAAAKNGAGNHVTAPEGVFFRGEINTVPSAALKPDSCFPSQAYVAPGNSFVGVTYLDAGATLGLTLGSAPLTMPRTSSGGVTTYGLASPASYTPGDSVFVSVPGATGGYPTSDLRAKTAEAFTLQPVTPTTSAYTQLRWTPASDTNSAMIIQLQFAPAGGTGAITREIRCAFRDDGVDSILSTKVAEWSAATNVQRTVVANRLRTQLKSVEGGGLQFISTYTVPTPTK